MNSHKERGAFESVTEDAAAAAPAPLQSLSAGCPGLTGPGDAHARGAALDGGGADTGRAGCYSALPETVLLGRGAGAALVAGRLRGRGHRGSSGCGGSSRGGGRGHGQGTVQDDAGGSSCA